MVVRMAKTTTRANEQKAEAPVEEHRHRQQHEQRDESREMLAEEAEPEPGHAVRAFQHDLQHAARMGRGVEGQRQFEHVLEIIRHHGETPTMREPIRMERDQHACADGEKPESHPGDDERRQDRECDRRRSGNLAARQHIDDAPEQDRLGESRDRPAPHWPGRASRRSEIRAELAENAYIKADQPHGR